MWTDHMKTIGCCNWKLLSFKWGLTKRCLCLHEPTKWYSIFLPYLYLCLRRIMMFLVDYKPKNSNVCIISWRKIGTLIHISGPWSWTFVAGRQITAICPPSECFCPPSKSSLPNAQNGPPTPVVNYLAYWKTGYTVVQVIWYRMHCACNSWKKRWHYTYRRNLNCLCRHSILLLEFSEFSQKMVIRLYSKGK